MKIHGIPQWPIAQNDDEIMLKNVLYSNSWWKNTGKYVKQFEMEFANYQQCKYGVAVTNGTVALEIALKGLGIKAEDEVIVPDFTFYSTVSAVMTIGAIPVLVDVKKDTFCIDPNEIKKAITKKTKAIIVVHIGGQICDMDEICAIAEENNLYIIEDSSHAPGAKWHNKKAGSFGHVGTFSFQNAKLLTAGEGGMLVSNDKELMHEVLLQSNCGREEGDTDYRHIRLATNARLSEFQAAVLHSQFMKLEEQMRLREKNYKYISQKLSKVKGIKLQEIDEKTNVHSHYMIMFYYNPDEFNGASRKKFIEYLQKIGIPASKSYKPIHELPLFQTIDNNKFRIVCKNGNFCSNTKEIGENVVCLSHNILLSDYITLDKIVDAIYDFKFCQEK